MINVTLDNGLAYQYPKFTTLLDIAKDVQHEYKYRIMGAIVNNNLRELAYALEEDSEVKFVDITSSYGNRIYTRSLSFLFIIAAKEVIKGCKVAVEHSLSKGLYCEIHGSGPLTKDVVRRIEEKMREIANKDLPFAKKKYSKSEAEKLFSQTGQYDKLELLKHRQKDSINIYSCMGYYDYFYGYLVPSTGYLDIFELLYYPPGIVLRFPTRDNPREIPEFFDQPKLFSIYREFEEWGKIMEIENISQLNDYILKGKVNELIWIAEALHEKKLAQIADNIFSSQEKKKLILISGPSSSGKTTFTQRLSIQLRVNGLKTVAISIDDFFKNREDTPKTPEGEYDFETIEAIDIDLFNEIINKLIAGEEVELPYFNFHTGKREWRGRKLKISEDHILLVEGIHGLNERLTQHIDDNKKYKIYISPLTHLNVDNHNRIPTSDLRLIRRMVRDYQFRSTDALTTIRRWDSVRSGEDKYIYPYQEAADIMFNSSLIYELSILKKTAMPLLEKIDKTMVEYVEAKRLMKFLDYLLPADSKPVPSNSILREFIGNSCFNV
ncbi:nucleoside kinase [Lutispora thermophila]|nr:nucleoside kinase [Lutispora thermophila]